MERPEADVPPSVGGWIDRSAIADAEREGVRGLRATIDLAPIGIAHLARDGRFLLVNHRLTALLGYTREELLARTFQELTFPADLPDCIALTAQLHAGEVESYRHEKRFVRRDGTPVWARVTVSAVRQPSGAVAFLVAVAEDITREREIEEARREAEERLRAALAASATGTFRWDLRTNVLEWDENLDRLFGLPAGVTARSLDQFLSLVHPDDRRRVMEACWVAADEGVDFEEEFRVRWPDGVAHWLGGKGRAICDETGLPLYMTGAATDVTRRVEAERALRESEAQLRRVVRLRDEVLAVVAHDLRNPMHTIGLSTSTMLELQVPEEERRRQLGLIQRSVHTMEHLISDLLDVTRIETGNFAIRRLPVQVPKLVEEVVEQIEPQATAREVALSVELAPALPPALGDPDRLAQVLSNLLANAVKFTEAGGRVQLIACRDHQYVLMAVRDTGRGIAAEDLPHVFDRFWQADRASRAGAGLGLAIVKGIVEAHGGWIGVESAPGCGTTVKFTVPCAQ